MRMELLLNTIWVLFSAATLAIWVSSRRFGRKNQSLIRGFVLLSCALVLLFPVISMTDDLHAQEMALTHPSSSYKRLEKAVHRSGHWLLHNRPAPPSSLAASLHNPIFHPFGLFLPQRHDLPATVLVAHQSGRAPPFSSSLI